VVFSARELAEYRKTSDRIGRLNDELMPKNQNRKCGLEEGFQAPIPTYLPSCTACAESTEPIPAPADLILQLSWPLTQPFLRQVLGMPLLQSLPIWRG
jgi:hypothetical protein